MPVDMSKYPSNWAEIVKVVKARAGNRCECNGLCGKHEGRCECVNGQPNPRTKSKVVLTTAHYPDPDPQNVDMKNLHSWCQQCHNTVDAPMRAKNRAEKRRQKQVQAGQLKMF